MIMNLLLYYFFFFQILNIDNKLLKEKGVNKVLQFLNLNLNDFKQPQSAYKVYCQQKNTRNQFGLNGSLIDSGYSTCGWIVDQVYYNCYNGSLSELAFKIKNLIQNQEEKFLQKNKHKHYKYIKLGLDNYIQKIYIRYLLRGSQKYIANISFQMNNNKYKTINCGRYNYTQTLRFNSKERLNGFRYKVQFNQLQSLIFYYHRIQSTNNQLSYNEAIQSTLLQRNIEKDVLEQKGPYGLEKGIYFIDPDRYSDWYIKKIMIQSNDYITAIQIQLENLIFNYKVISKIHGQFNQNQNVQKIIIPKDKKISKVIFYLNIQGFLQGLQFMINNSMQTKIYGKKTFYKKILQLHSSEIPIGFFGYVCNNKIGSLGIITSKQRGDSMAIYV